MQLGGNPKRVKLNVDLTEYDNRLTAGQEGITIPNIQLSMWGSMDTFVAVKFDCGVKLDIPINLLDFKGKYINSDKDSEFSDEEIKTITNVIKHIDKKGKFIYLSYEYVRDDKIPSHCGICAIDFRKSANEMLDLFKSLNLPINVVTK